jgi:hypothetical protein
MAKKQWEAGNDPTPLFDWPLCRFIAVFGSSDDGGETIMDAEQMREWRNKQRRKKGLPEIKPGA